MLEPTGMFPTHCFHDYYKVSLVLRVHVAVNNAVNTLEQESIPVGCAPPALYRTGGSPWQRAPLTKRPSPQTETTPWALDRGPPLDRNPPSPWTGTPPIGQKPPSPLDRDTYWTEIRSPLDRDPPPGQTQTLWQSGHIPAKIKFPVFSLC